MSARLFLSKTGGCGPAKGGAFEPPAGFFCHRSGNKEYRDDSVRRGLLVHRLSIVKIEGWRRAGGETRPDRFRFVLIPSIRLREAPVGRRKLRSAILGLCSGRRPRNHVAEMADPARCLWPGKIVLEFFISPGRNVRSIAVTLRRACFGSRFPGWDSECFPGRVGPFCAGSQEIPAGSRKRRIEVLLFFVSVALLSVTSLPKPYTALRATAAARRCRSDIRAPAGGTSPVARCGDRVNVYCINDCIFRRADISGCGGRVRSRSFAVMGPYSDRSRLGRGSLSSGKHGSACSRGASTYPRFV